MDWNEAARQGKYIFDWMAEEDDYGSNHPAARFLSERGELKIVSELQLELFRKNETLITIFLRETLITNLTN
jgi:hypothetical protein